jgi:acetyl-CoA C-acetyltransferase
MSGSFLIAARRSPVVPRNGAFAHLSIEDLATPVLKAALNDAKVAPEDVGEIVIANSLGEGGNPARIIALNAGLPNMVAGLTIDRQCVGGLDALLLADAMIRSGHHQLVVAGGVESYSRRPLRYRTFSDGRNPVAYEQARFTPWIDRDPDMARAADKLANDRNIPKAEQDAWAVESHRKALAATSMNYRSGVVAIEGIANDPFTRNLTRGLCDRAPVVAGSITKANMSVAADGAALIVMASRQFVEDNNIDAVEFVAGATVGGIPELPGIAPVEAMETVLKASGISLEDLTCAEVMEAFASQAIACQRGAKIPTSIVNLRGGSLARGHPIGASGAVLAVNVFNELLENPGIGIVAIAAAGGLGSAAVFRSPLLRKVWN